MSAPPMPEGFTDRAAWDAIHWTFGSSPLLDEAVIEWQRNNQRRVRAAAVAAIPREEPSRVTADPLAVTEYCGNENCRLPLNAVGLCTRCDSFRTEIALAALVRRSPFGVCPCGAEVDERGCPHGH